MLFYAARGIIISVFSSLFSLFIVAACCSRHFLTTWLNCLSDCKDLRTFPLDVILHDVQRSGKVHFSSSSNFQYKRSFATRRAFFVPGGVVCGANCHNSRRGYASEFNFLLISVYECHHSNAHMQSTNISISLSESRLFDFRHSIDPFFWTWEAIVVEVHRNLLLFLVECLTLGPAITLIL